MQYVEDKIRTILQQEADAILSIPLPNSFTYVVGLIYTLIHTSGESNKLIVSGMGKAGQIALNIATTFSSTGTPAVFLHPAEAQHGDLGIIQQGDVLLVLSNSGKTREIIELIDLAKNLYPWIPIIAILGNIHNPISEKVNCVIQTGITKEVCPLGLTPTTSTTVMTVIGDILVTLMMEKIGFTKEDYAKRHHGGYLGEITNHK